MSKLQLILFFIYIKLSFINFKNQKEKKKSSLKLVRLDKKSKNLNIKYILMTRAFIDNHIRQQFNHIIN